MGAYGMTGKGLMRVSKQKMAHTKMGFCSERDCTPCATKGRMTLASSWVPSGCKRKEPVRNPREDPQSKSQTWATTADDLDVQRLWRSRGRPL